MKNSQLKILVIKLHAIGDLVIATPALRRLQQGFPSAKIDLFTLKWTCPAAVANPIFDEIHVVENDLFFKPGIVHIPALIKEIIKLRRYRYDAVVIFHRHSMVRRFAGLLGIPYIFCFDNPNGMGVPLDEDRHSALTAWELADKAVDKLDGEECNYPELDELKYEWFVTSDEEKRADKILNELDLVRKRFAVLFPGGGEIPYYKMYDRRWSARKFAGLAEKLLDKYGLQSVLMGGTTDIEVCTEVSGQAKISVTNLAGKYDLRLTAGLLSKARIAVSNDSAPLHIAAAVGTPVVGIFGPTGANTKLPPGDIAVEAATGIPCSPCYFSVFRGCIFDSIRCMKELEIMDVMTAVSQLLSTESTVSDD